MVLRLISRRLQQKADFINKLLASGQELIIQVPSILIFSFLMANILNQNFRGRTFARAVLFMPVITSAGVAATLLTGGGAFDESQMASMGAQAMNIARKY